MTELAERPAELGASADIADALRRAGLVGVDTSTRRRAEYSTDASNYRVVPQVVAFPRHTDEVAAAVAVCRDLGVPLTPRGGGTSIAGNAIGPGVVLDFSPHLHRIGHIDPEARTARVEPGVVLDSLQAAAAPHGLRFGPDPSTHARATMGGLLGNDSCGSRALAYGRTSDNVVDLDVLLADGTAFTARRLARDGLRGAGVPHAERLADLVESNLSLLRTEFGRFARQVSGYSLENLLPENGCDLARTWVGTEGTWGVLTGATVKLVQAPKATALAVLGYADMAAAADAAPALLPHKPVAVEGMDAALVDVIRRRRGAAAVPDLPRGNGWLFVEMGADTLAAAQAAARALVRDADALGSTVVTGTAAATLWRIREDGTGLAGRSPDNRPAWPGWEDTAVPVEKLGAYLREFFALLADFDLQTLAFGHFGDGCVHSRIDFPLTDRPRVMGEFLEAAATLVAGYGGSMSGEHGDGRARGALLPHMYSADGIALQAAVKDVFDPAGLLNPGVIVRPAPIDADLRVPAARPLRRHLAFALPHDNGDLTAAVHRCVGVGKCRADTSAGGGVMCPSYLATRDEKDSTRGRARVLQEMANGSLVTAGWRAPEVAESLDLCLSCKGCAVDCPAGVDMATYKAEVLHQRYRRRLRPPSHYSLGMLPRWSRLASRAPRLANGALRLKPLAALAKRLGGIDQRRPLPRFAAQTFREWFAGHQVTTGEPIVLWIDTFTDHFSPGVGRAAVAVLEDAGYSVRVPDGPVCCGLTWVSTGQLDGAKRQLRRTLDALQPYLEQNLTVVGLEPSCTATLRTEAADLLPHDRRAATLGGRMRTLAEVLADSDGWRTPELSDVTAVAQPHCHQHATAGFAADTALLTDAGASLTTVGGCCGLAGNFGVERGHYDVSVAVAENHLLPAVRAADADTILLADGFSCRTQLDQLMHRDSQHLAQLLASRLTRQRVSGGDTDERRAQHEAAPHTVPAQEDAPTEQAPTDESPREGSP